MRAVRQGRGYFQLLQKEERDAQEAKEKVTQGHAGPQPPRFSLDSDSVSER